MASPSAPQTHRHGHYDRIPSSACSPYWWTDIAGELVYLVSGYAGASAAALVSLQVTGCGLRISMEHSSSISTATIHSMINAQSALLRGLPRIHGRWGTSKPNRRLQGVKFAFVYPLLTLVSED